jgi:hypothetical protein
MVAELKESKVPQGRPQPQATVKAGPKTPDAAVAMEAKCMSALAAFFQPVLDLRAETAKDAIATASSEPRPKRLNSAQMARAVNILFDQLASLSAHGLVPIPQAVYVDRTSAEVHFRAVTEQKPPPFYTTTQLAAMVQNGQLPEGQEQLTITAILGESPEAALKMAAPTHAPDVALFRAKVFEAPVRLLIRPQVVIRVGRKWAGQEIATPVPIAQPGLVLAMTPQGTNQPVAVEVARTVPLTLKGDKTYTARPHDTIYSNPEQVAAGTQAILDLARLLR